MSDRIRSWLKGALVALVGLAAAAPALAMEVIDSERELKLLGQGVTPPKRFGNVAFRVAGGVLLLIGLAQKQPEGMV